MVPNNIAVALLTATALVGPIGCGGKTQGSQPGAEAGSGLPEAGVGGVGDGSGVGGMSRAGGAAGGASGAGGGPNGLPGPNTISLVVGGAEPLVSSEAAATCLRSFEGFSARIGGFTVELEAFIQEPGEYTGDPLRILYLDVKSDGRDYCGTGGLATCLGWVRLHARAVEPRFSGELEAEVLDRSDTGAPPLEIKLRFDVADRTDCP